MENFNAATHPPFSANNSLGAMNQARLERRLRALAWGEKQVLAGFLRHLAEFDRRQAYAPLGFPSLFEYCTRELGLSRDEAYLRIQAARISGDYPEILGMLARGELHLSVLAKISPHMNSLNAEKLLAGARGKTKREVERLVAGFLDAAPIQPDAIRFLPSPRQKEEGSYLESELRISFPAAPTSPAAAEGSPAGPVSTSPGLPKGADGPLPARLVRISFTASEELLAKIDRAKALLRHKHPPGRLEPLVDEAFEVLLAKVDPGRRLPRKRVRAADPGQEKPGSSRIPRRIRDEVWRRDEGRCAFISDGGTRCPGVDWLEYDHILPWALGGSSLDPGNIRLACRTHNQLAAERIFGKWRPSKPRNEGQGGVS